MSFMQFQQRCSQCGEQWNAAFGIVGTTQIAAPPSKCPKCGSSEISKVANVWDVSPLSEREREFIKWASCGGVPTGKVCSVDGHNIYGPYHSDKDGNNAMCEFHSMQLTIKDATAENARLRDQQKMLVEALKRFERQPHTFIDQYDTGNGCKPECAGCSRDAALASLERGKP